MLYNKDWDRTETKHDVFSLEALAAWLATMPPAQEYDWAGAEVCMLGQWCASQGLAGDELRDMSLYLGNWGMSPNTADVALGKLSECTFGAALERARKLSGEASGLHPDR